MTRKDTLNDTNFAFSHSLLHIFDKGRQLPVTVKLENFFFSFGCALVFAYLCKTNLL